MQQLGWDVINMTAYPEGHLARELELCYANVSRLRELLSAVIPRIGAQPQDACATALAAAQI